LAYYEYVPLRQVPRPRQPDSGLGCKRLALVVCRPIAAGHQPVMRVGFIRGAGVVHDLVRACTSQPSPTWRCRPCGAYDRRTPPSPRPQCSTIRLGCSRSERAPGECTADRTRVLRKLFACRIDRPSPRSLAANILARSILRRRSEASACQTRLTRADPAKSPQSGHLVAQIRSMSAVLPKEPQLPPRSASSSTQIIPHADSIESVRSAG